MVTVGVLGVGGWDRERTEMSVGRASPAVIPAQLISDRFANEHTRDELGASVRCEMRSVTNQDTVAMVA